MRCGQARVPKVGGWSKRLRLVPKVSFHPHLHQHQHQHNDAYLRSMTQMATNRLSYPLPTKLTTPSVDVP